MTETIEIEILGGFISSILLGIIYRVYKYYKKRSLCFLTYDNNENTYTIRNDREEHVITINMERLIQQKNKLEKDLEVLEKSKLVFNRNKLSCLLSGDDNNIINVEPEAIE